MRIAASGAHAVGKTTLLTDLHRKLPAYETAEEPYHDLADAGHDFADVPSVDDFVSQLEHSINRITSDRATDMLYDRCPADLLAYLVALGTAEAVREWLPSASDALSTVDIIVFVPIERPDRTGGTHGADPLRRKVDVVLREMLIEDSFGFGRPVITVHGTPDERVNQVLAGLRDIGLPFR